MKREFCSRFGSHGQRLMLAVGLRRELPTITANGAVIVASMRRPRDVKREI